MKSLLYQVKELLKRFLRPEWICRYHASLSKIAAWWYRNPSEELWVVGVTGTNGKSTTVMMIGKILEAAGERVGWSSTATIKIDTLEYLNAFKMTMLGRFATQRLLRQMVTRGCTVAVIETSSQGIEQFRHSAIHYDIIVFTNLTPEHIEAHGGFEAYKQAKGKLFGHLAQSKTKTILLPGKGPILPTSVVNMDDPNALYFLSFSVPEKIGYGIHPQIEHTVEDVRMLLASHVDAQPRSSSFSVEGEQFNLPLMGKFNVYNALSAIAATRPFDVPLSTCAKALAKIDSLPGRVEFIDEGQSFMVLVDYAPEPEGLRQLYESIHQLSYNRIIHILGSAGGGRDVSRRAVLGRLAAQHASVVIVTNEDPYDEPPMHIIDQVAQGAEDWKMQHPDAPMNELLKVRERHKAIERAVFIAKPGDIVVATGKGAEQAICIAKGRTIAWDERVEFRKALRALLSDKQ